MHRDFRAEHQTMRSGNPWPRRSQALGVSPAQIPEAREHARRHGYQVDFDELGTAIIPSRSEQNKMLRAIGFCDYDAGYGDVTPGTYKGD